MTRVAALSSIAACFATLTFSLAVSGFTYQAVSAAMLGAAWFILHLRRITRFSWLMFSLFGLISAGILWVGISLWFALTALVFDLLAWDLTAFEERLEEVADRGDIRRMELVHFARLFLAIGIGVTGVIASNLIHIKLTLGSALIFALLGIWGISALVYRLRA
jgi:hypothetical protein